VSGDEVGVQICVATMQDNVRVLLAQQTQVSSCNIRVWTSCQVWFVRHAFAYCGREAEASAGRQAGAGGGAVLRLGRGRRVGGRLAGLQAWRVNPTDHAEELERAVLAAAVCLRGRCGKRGKAGPRVVAPVEYLHAASEQSSRQGVERLEVRERGSPGGPIRP